VPVAFAASDALGPVSTAADGAGIARDALAGAPPAVGRRALRLLAEAAVGAPCPRVGARLEEILALRPSGGGDAALDLGDGVRAVVARGRVRCTPSPRRS
jgi:tRNA(Ile)-lysidine synthase